MAAGVCNLLIQQGETFSRIITLTDNQVVPVAIDLTGYTARAQMRTAANAADIVESFTCTISAPTTGVIVISLTATETSAIPTVGKTAYDKVSKYVWDMEIESAGGIVTRILNGAVEVSPEVTRT